jgi:biopolymer transport protein ExbD
VRGCAPGLVTRYEFAKPDTHLPSRVSNTLVQMAPRPLLIAGVVTLLVGLLVPHCIQHWFNSRAIEPVDVPAEINSEKIQTIHFNINFQGTYWVDLEFNESQDVHSEYCSPGTLPRPTWKVDRLARWYQRHSVPWAESSTGYGWANGMNLDGFRAQSGAYLLKMTFPKGTECLKERQPRVVIRTSDLYSYEEGANIISSLFLYFGAVGLGCVAWALVIWSHRYFSNELSLRLFPEVIPRNHLRLLRHRPMPLITQLPNFGLMYGAVLWILVLFFMIFAGRDHSHGLPIELRTRYSPPSQKSPSKETLGVYLAVGEKYYVNGQLVSREELGAKLKKELSRRTDWTVYFEADHDTLNMNAIYVMDTIQGLTGKLVWITPKVREELQQKDQPYWPIPVK